MDTIVVVILGISGLAVIALTLWSSATRTKSSVKWLKGYNLKRNISPEAVVDLFNKIKYPEKESAILGDDGSIIYTTKVHSYPVEISNDANGYTIVGLLVNWGRVSKKKRKKVAFDWDNTYQFLMQEVEGKEVVDAMRVYEKNMKMQKLLNIASGICVASIIVFLIISL